jgi:hypothetical protein
LQTRCEGAPPNTGQQKGAGDDPAFLPSWRTCLTDWKATLFALPNLRLPSEITRLHLEAWLSFRKRNPDLNISEESAAEMVAALVFALSDGKPHKIARRVAMMRETLAARAEEQKVVLLRSPLCPNGTKARASEALARMERVEVILKEMARL